MWVFFEHSGEETQGVGVEFFVLVAFESDVAGSVLRKHLVVGLSRESTHSQQQNVEYQPQAENVADWIILGLHVFDVDDLGSDVAWGAAPDEEILVAVGEFSQSEVSYDALEAALRAEQDVLRLEISVHDPFAVHFLEAEQDGVHDDPGLLGLELVLGLDLVVELPALQQFNHDVKGVLRLEHLMKFHTVLLVQSSHDLNFFDQALFAFVLAVGCFLRKCLYRETLPHLQLLS